MPREAPITPVPIPAGADGPSDLLVFGGTFDPPHRGHIELPVRVRDELERRVGGRDWILYVPAARSPHKDRSPLASDADRLEMLRLALAEARTARAAVWTDEIDSAAKSSPPAGVNPSPSFTIDTLTRLRAWLDEHGASGTHLRLLIGADQASSFHRWRQPRDILRLAKPLVMVRGEVGDAVALERTLEGTNYWQPAELGMWREALVSVGRVDVSATQVRDALAAGTGAETLLASSVAEYIREHGLYRR